jgi:hypothetical protein
VPASNRSCVEPPWRPEVIARACGTRVDGSPVISSPLGGYRREAGGERDLNASAPAIGGVRGTARRTNVAGDWRLNAPPCNAFGDCSDSMAFLGWVRSY